jgi:SpoVK/Ycf46/Vps4 family AAA+-type ATPase
VKDALEFSEYPTLSGSHARDAFPMEQPMEQPTTPAEPTPVRSERASSGGRPPAPVHSRLHHARLRRRAALQWRTFNRIANVVALCASPPSGWPTATAPGSQLHAFLATWGRSPRARHVRHPRPPLHPLAEPVRRREVWLKQDTGLRRRIAFWRFIWRFSIGYLTLFGVFPYVLDVLRGNPANFVDSIVWGLHRVSTVASFWNGMDASNRAQLLFILLINLMIGAIFIVPMVLMAVRQMKSYEPGDASWGVEIDHVRGQADVKEEVRKIIELWQAGEQFKLSGGKPERGLLFIGPPGTGKTMLAKAIATGFNAPFMAVPGSGFAQTFIGMDVVAVQWMGHKAKKLARKWGGHCIVFIDEIDAVGMRRAALGGASAEPPHTEMPMFGPRGTRTASGDVIIESREWRDYIGAQMADADRPVVRRGPISTIARAVVPGMFGGGQGSGALNQLLVVMDGVDNPPFLRRIGTRFVNTLMDASYIVPQRIWKIGLRMPRPKPRNDQVFFIGATNVPLDVLDPALTRAGRMGRQVQFRIPNKVDRADVLDFYLAKVAHTPDLDAEKPRDELARMTAGYSPAMIEQVCSIALMAAHHDGRAAFDRTDILTAMGTWSRAPSSTSSTRRTSCARSPCTRPAMRPSATSTWATRTRPHGSRSACAPTARAATGWRVRRTIASSTSGPSTSRACSRPWRRSRPSTSSTARTRAASEATCRASRTRLRSWSATPRCHRSACRCRRR